MEVTPLAWDSSFFGLRIGKAVLSSENDAEARMRRESRLREMFDLIYVFSNQDVFSLDPAILHANKKVNYKKLLDGTDASHPSVKEWDSRTTTQDLVDLALESGKYSRFKRDQRFPIGSFERLYSKWIEQSVSHVIATHVFCYFVEDKPRGLVTLDIRGNAGDIGLVAVDKNFQHRHIGSALLHHACQFAYQQGIDTITVPTQFTNRPACLFYESLGFSIDSIINVWHWWL